MPPCSQRGCVALATNGSLCALHAAGYAQHDGSLELRCERCRSLIKKGEWYRRDGTGARHSKACKEHADVAKERKAAEDRAHA